MHKHSGNQRGHFLHLLSELLAMSKCTNIQITSTAIFSISCQLFTMFKCTNIQITSTAIFSICYQILAMSKYTNIQIASVAIFQSATSYLRGPNAQTLRYPARPFYP
eukprot:scpid108013/ scgid23494/ 